MSITFVDLPLSSVEDREVFSFYKIIFVADRSRLVIDLDGQDVRIEKNPLSVGGLVSDLQKSFIDRCPVFPGLDFPSLLGLWVPLPFANKGLPRGTTFQFSSSKA